MQPELFPNPDSGGTSLLEQAVAKLQTADDFETAAAELFDSLILNTINKLKDKKAKYGIVYPSDEIQSFQESLIILKTQLPPDLSFRIVDYYLNIASVVEPGFERNERLLGVLCKEFDDEVEASMDIFAHMADFAGSGSIVPDGQLQIEMDVVDSAPVSPAQEFANKLNDQVHTQLAIVHDRAAEGAKQLSSDIFGEECLQTLILINEEGDFNEAQNFINELARGKSPQEITDSLRQVLNKALFEASFKLDISNVSNLAKFMKEAPIDRYIALAIEAAWDHRVFGKTREYIDRNLISMAKNYVISACRPELKHQMLWALDLIN